MNKRFSIGLIAVMAVCIVALLAHRVGRNVSRNRADPFRYDVSEFSKTDPSLVLYSEVIQIKATIVGIHAIAVDSEDRIYIGGQNAVEVFVGPDEMPRFDVVGAVKCLAVAPDGDIFVGLSDHIEVYGKDGAKKAAWNSLGSDAILTSIAVSSNEVFAADFGNRIVWKFNRAGELLCKIGERDNDKRRVGFVVPSPYFDVAVGKGGTLWVANTGVHRIEHFTRDGELLSFWGKASMKIEDFCGCCNPSHIAIMPDGKFVTSEKGIPRVKLYEADGKFIGVVAGSEHFEKDTVGLDLAVDSHGQIFVLDPKAEVVRMFVNNQEKRQEEYHLDKYLSRPLLVQPDKGLP